MFPLELLYSLNEQNREIMVYLMCLYLILYYFSFRHLANNHTDLNINRRTQLFLLSGTRLQQMR